MIHIALLLFMVVDLTAQTLISGMVMSGQEPLVGVNVFIAGTIDGCLTELEDSLFTLPRQEK